MRATGPEHPRRDDGSAVDATFELSQIPWFEIVYHHKAGGRDSPRSVNPDYHEGLELLLSRLASVRAKILSISIDSSIAQGLSPDDRELALPFPIDLGAETDCATLRLDITRAQKSVGRRVGAKPGGGNDQKRIRITVALYSGAVAFDDLRTLLVDGASAVPPVSEAEEPATSETDPEARRRRRPAPVVLDLVAAGILPSGTRLVARVRGETVSATLLDGIEARLDGELRTESLGQLTNRLAGHSQSAMRMWSIVRDGHDVPLHVLRDELAASDEWRAPAQASGSTRSAPHPKAPPGVGLPAARRPGDHIDESAARRFIESVPSGRWTSYKDVAEAAGAPRGAQAIGRWLAREGESVPNVWRVMTTAGVPSSGWTAAAAGIPPTVQAVIKRLAQEGVTFTDGAAAADKRWSARDAGPA